MYATPPEIISASVFHQIDPKWAIRGDVTQTRWNRIPELRIDFANPLKSDGVETLNWENAWRCAVGVTHYYSDRWTWRTGIAYDQTPVPIAESRTACLLDSNRRWLASSIALLDPMCGVFWRESLAPKTDNALTPGYRSTGRGG